MKKQGDENTSTISLLKKISGIHFKVFHKCRDADDKYTEPFSLELFLHINMRMCIFMCIYVYFICVTHVAILFYCCF